MIVIMAFYLIAKFLLYRIFAIKLVIVISKNLFVRSDIELLQNRFLSHK